ncbi:type II secretion system protein [Haloferula sp.]|uniref:type II secretion system protein n=1 Tax=Haloferula sp. TaxID=2497595 RepID=UPI00329BA87E
MKSLNRTRGFTLVELMVVIVIVTVLASLVFMFSNRAMNKAEKVTAIQQMRDLSAGMEAYIADYKTPPIPGGKAPGSDRNKEPGWDTIYGDPPQPNRNYGNEAIIGPLSGDSASDFQMDNGEVFRASELNPKGNQYVQFKYSEEKKNGVGEDGRLYDPWGHEVIIAINAHAPNSTPDERRLNTYGLGEWTDKKPRFERYAFWSYGKDGVKQDTYSNSDDVVFW